MDAVSPAPRPCVDVRMLIEVWVRHGLAHLLVRMQGGAVGYRARCACGAVGPRYQDAAIAERSWLVHVIGVALRSERMSPDAAQPAAGPTSDAAGSPDGPPVAQR